MRIAAVALTLVLAACASSFLLHPPGESSIQGGVYVNRTYDLRVQFPKQEGWWFLTRARDISKCGYRSAILCAGNPARLVNLVVTLEDGGYEMENEDYQASIENQVLEGWGDKLEASSVESVRTRQGDAYVWTYTLDGDVLTQAFLKRGTQNMRLIFIVPENAYDRRRDEIGSIIRSIELAPQPGSDPVARAL